MHPASIIRRSQARRFFGGAVLLLGTTAFWGDCSQAFDDSAPFPGVVLEDSVLAEHGDSAMVTVQLGTTYAFPITAEVTGSIVAPRQAQFVGAQARLYLVPLSTTQGNFHLLRVRWHASASQVNSDDVLLLIPDIRVTTGAMPPPIRRGDSASIPVRVRRIAGKRDTTVLRTTLPATYFPRFVPAALGPDDSVSTLHFRVPASAVTGPQSFLIQGVAGRVQREAQATIDVLSAPTGDFVITFAAPYQSGVSLYPGDSAFIPVHVDRFGSLPVGNITLDLPGAPFPGASVRFNPSTTADSIVTLELRTLRSAATGSYSLAVRGTAGALTHTVSLPVSIVSDPRSFTVSVPPTIAIRTPGVTTIPVHLPRVSTPFPVTLSVTGLPSDVVASFASNPTTDTMVTLTLQAAANPQGSSNLIAVTGTGNGITRVGQATLVRQPALTIRAVLGAVLPPGRSAIGRVIATRFPGVAEPVTLSVSGLPPGVTATFAPNPMTGDTSVVTWTAALDARGGSAIATVTGVTPSGLTASDTVRLTTPVSPIIDYAFGQVSPVLLSGRTPFTVSTTVPIIRGNALTAPIQLALSGLPPGVTATIAPNPAPGTSTSITFDPVNAQGTGTWTVTLTGDAQGIVRATTIAVTVR